MYQIPLKATPSQLLGFTVNGQNVQLHLYQKEQGLFADVNCNDVDISTGVLALNRVGLVRQNYLGFSGNLLFRDTQGSSDPDYTGLADRFQLMYLTDAEYAEL